jgi:hypothetical protein
LDNEESLFPSPEYPGQKHQEDAIPLGAQWPFVLSAEDDELLK